MDRRRSPRVEAVYPVRIWGLDANANPFIENARATSISSGGALIQGFRRQVRLGELLEVQLGEKSASFGWYGSAKRVTVASWAWKACPQRQACGILISTVACSSRLTASSFGFQPKTQSLFLTPLRYTSGFSGIREPRLTSCEAQSDGGRIR